MKKSRKKYDLTENDLKLREGMEKEKGYKFSDEQFYRYIKKLRKFMDEYVAMIKKWVDEHPGEAKQTIEQFKHLEGLIKKEKLYEDISKIKKLTVAELRNLLSSVLEKQDYIKLELNSPEIDRYIIIGFSVQDSRDGRVEYDSRIGLQNLIKHNLSDTNWRLMSEGINYRLGILSGRLKGYESKDDLLNLIKNV